MMEETVQQGNLFSGDWESKQRRKVRIEQTAMFTLRETFEFGGKAHPTFGESRTPVLELVREDVRTLEEVERDLLREAEALTSPMFTSETQLDENGTDPEVEEADDKEVHTPPPTPTVSEENPKLSSYLALVALAHEQGVTLWVDEAYRGRYYAQMPQAILSAHGAGLTDSEISAALQIGEFRGKKEREAAPQVSGQASGINGDESTPDNTQTTIRDTIPHEGFRARVRRDHIPLRTRQHQPTTSEIVPGLCMEQEYICKRLPYLAEGIMRIGEDELVSLAESVSEALQETYWTILGTTLAHYLDHEQRGRVI